MECTTHPVKGSSMRSNYGSEAKTIRFKLGFPNHFRRYEDGIVRKRTELIEQFSNSKFDLKTTLDIKVTMKRLKSDAIDINSQLVSMQFEIQDIVEHFEFYEIPGINDLSFLNSMIRIYKGIDNYDKSDREA